MERSSARGNVLPFPRRALRHLPAINATLIRNSSIRRYIVRRGRGPSEWYCEVSLGNVRLRGTATERMTEVMEYVEECRREIEHLLARGWRFK